MLLRRGWWSWYLCLIPGGLHVGLHVGRAEKHASEELCLVGDMLRLLLLLLLSVGKVATAWLCVCVCVWRRFIWRRLVCLLWCCRGYPAAHYVAGGALPTAAEEVVQGVGTCGVWGGGER